VSPPPAERRGALHFGGRPHQLFDTHKVLDDPVALRILGDEGRRRLAQADQHRGRIARAFRAFMVVRSRFAEDELARSISRG
jgi:O-methyltransferase involved in polyketide biosynthesis